MGKTVRIADYMAKSRFAVTVLGFMPELEVRRIRTKEDYEAVFRLRYKAYRQNALIEPNEDKRSIDNYDLLENCQIFGLFVRGELMSSIRTHHLTAETPHAPSLRIFGDIVMPKVEAGETFIDGSRLCVDRELAAELPAIPFLTVRIAYMASVHVEADYNLSVIRSEHSAFYRRYYGFERWAGGRTVDWYKLPIDLYAGDMAKNREPIEKRLPFMRSSFEERAVLFGDDLPDQGITSVYGLFGNEAVNPGPTGSAEAARALARAAER